MQTPDTPRRATLSPAKLIVALVAAAVLVVGGYKAFRYYQYNSDRELQAEMREMALRQKREFVPGELVMATADSTVQTRVLSCAPGSDGMQGDCKIDVEYRGSDEVAPDTISALELTVRENLARREKGWPLINGRLSDRELAPMLASWSAASRAAAGGATVPATTPPAQAVQTAQTAPPAQPVQSAPAPAAEAPAPAAGGGGLKPGEYACYGSGGQIMAGLGFRVDAAGRYTDLDKTTSGTASVSGTSVTFSGGHMDGMTGRDLKQGATHFTIGAMASCERWG